MLFEPVFVVLYKSEIVTPNISRKSFCLFFSGSSSAMKSRVGSVVVTAVVTLKKQKI